MVRIKFIGISCDIDPGKCHGTTLMMSTLVQLMAWCRPATCQCVRKCKAVQIHEILRDKWQGGKRANLAVRVMVRAECTPTGIISTNWSNGNVNLPWYIAYVIKYAHGIGMFCFAYYINRCCKLLCDSISMLNRVIQYRTIELFEE